MTASLEQLPKKAKEKLKENKKLFEKLKKRVPKNLDVVLQDLHEEVFEQTDCLKCANCCKTTSPVFTQKDIEKIADFLRIRPAEMIEKYLKIDEDKDYVLKSSPCIFLDSQNYCKIYEVRPKACQGYPHTDRKNFHNLFEITLKNTAICPAVFDIVEKLNKIYC
ncbi:MAG: YkgJ family cysteine cluster protein [Bacteroidetes bacterium]|nr:MAG: YkgJ family cysteine cluster protein [Bacteroidota bacterium]